MASGSSRSGGRAAQRSGTRGGRRGTAPAKAVVAPPEPAHRWGVATPFVVISLLLSLAGLGVSTYLTIAHYNSGVVLSCPNTGVINCAKVTSSAQSSILGVPVAVLGLLFFIAMVLLCLPQAWRREELTLPRLGATLVGLAMILYLVYAELFILDAICLWCTSVHVITFLLFVTVAFATAMDPRRIK